MTPIHPRQQRHEPDHRRHIANYLSNTPDFFERHAQLLAQVQLTSPHGNLAVSLRSARPKCCARRSRRWSTA